MACKKKALFVKGSDDLVIAESLARDGFDNKQIAKRFNYNETYFSELVNTISELSDALKRGRQPLELYVENSLYKRATGLKVRTQVRRFIEKDCDCCGDKKCTKCDGTGKIATDMEFVQETITELPPDTGAAMAWLKQRKPEYWNKQPLKLEVNANVKQDIVKISYE